MPLQTLRSIRDRHVHQGRPLSVGLEAELRDDPRPGARSILAAVERQRHERRCEGQRLRTMLRFETSLWQVGFTRIAGIDEAGVSPLAGPVAAAAVVLRPGTRIPEGDDSKKLGPACRERLAAVVKERAVAWSVVLVEPNEIDRFNIYWAGILAMRRAVLRLVPPPEYLLLDARKLRDIGCPQQSIVHGDGKSLSISAASILAKTTRDAYMVAQDGIYPGYGFRQHKGYPVREHLKTLKTLGPCPIHRLSFAPVRKVLGLPPLPPWDEVRAGAPALPPVGLDNQFVSTSSSA